MVVKLSKGDIIMEYQYEVKQEVVRQTKEEFMHEDQWADSLIKWLFIFNNCRHTLYCICCCSILSF